MNYDHRAGDGERSRIRPRQAVTIAGATRCSQRQPQRDGDRSKQPSLTPCTVRRRASPARLRPRRHDDGNCDDCRRARLCERQLGDRSGASIAAYNGAKTITCTPAPRARLDQLTYSVGATGDRPEHQYDGRVRRSRAAAIRSTSPQVSAHGFTDARRFSFRCRMSRLHGQFTISCPGCTAISGHTTFCIRPRRHIQRPILSSCLCRRSLPPWCSVTRPITA